MPKRVDAIALTPAPEYRQNPFWTHYVAPIGAEAKIIAALLPYPSDCPYLIVERDVPNEDAPLEPKRRHFALIGSGRTIPDAFVFVAILAKEPHGYIMLYEVLLN